MGCAGDTDETTAPYKLADAEQAARVAPATGDWEWPEKPSSFEIDTPDENEKPPDASNNPPLAELLERTKDLEDLGGATSRWEDEDKLANLGISLLESAADAQIGTNAYRVFLSKWGEDFGGVTKNEIVDDLGEEAWVISIVGNGNQVTYEWRRRNLVVSAHMHCFGVCPPDVDSAARQWASAIDAELTAGVD